jgi:hypothetical protein
MRTLCVVSVVLVLLGCPEKKTASEPVAPVAAVAPPAAAPVVAAAPPAKTERPLYYDRELTPADLEGRSLRELSLMRNWIFARVGHKFRKEWLAEFFAAQPWYKPQDTEDLSKLSAADRANAKTIAAYDGAAAREQLLASRDRLKDGTVTPEDEIELRLISERLGQWVGDAAEDRNPLSDPSMLDKVISVKSLADLSRRDLRILRNTVFARHGRQFKSELMADYFANMDWYREDPGYTDKMLTMIDKKNIQIIKSVEDSLGGPLTDQEQSEEQDAWYGVA